MHPFDDVASAYVDGGLLADAVCDVDLQRVTAVSLLAWQWMIARNYVLFTVVVEEPRRETAVPRA